MPDAEDVLTSLRYIYMELSKTGYIRPTPLYRPHQCHEVEPYSPNRRMGNRKSPLNGFITVNNHIEHNESSCQVLSASSSS